MRERERIGERAATQQLTKKQNNELERTTAERTNKRKRETTTETKEDKQREREKDNTNGSKA